MSHVSPTQAEAHLQQVAEQFHQWRQSRATPRGYRIPEALWTEALSLTEVFSVAQVAKQLHLKPQALKRRQGAPGAKASSPAPAFVEVAPPPWRTSPVAVEVQRPDGTLFRITYSESAPAVSALLQTFLEVR
ncbi:MAG: hypothetical protein FJ147_24560 [Deltaproteobacteria bacterium]|nr:hypothetical protein [Deltaproteobacteria bacterium]